MLPWHCLVCDCCSASCSLCHVQQDFLCILSLYSIFAEMNSNSGSEKWKPSMRNGVESPRPYSKVITELFSCPLRSLLCIAHVSCIFLQRILDSLSPFPSSDLSLWLWPHRPTWNSPASASLLQHLMIASREANGDLGLKSNDFFELPLMLGIAKVRKWRRNW